MKYASVLGIGYSASEFDMERKKWNIYGIDFHSVADVRTAISYLRSIRYTCIALCSENLLQDELALLMGIQALPVVVIPPSYTPEQHYACIRFGATRYVQMIGRHGKKAGKVRTRENILPTFSMFDPSAPTVLVYHDLRINVDSHTVEVCGTRVDLSAREFRIFVLMMMNRDKIITLDMLKENIWKDEKFTPSRNVIEKQLSNIRRKLRVHPDSPNYITNIRGVGYQLKG